MLSHLASLKMALAKAASKHHKPMKLAYCCRSVAFGWWLPAQEHRSASPYSAITLYNNGKVYYSTVLYGIRSSVARLVVDVACPLHFLHTHQLFEVNFFLAVCDRAKGGRMGASRVSFIPIRRTNYAIFFTVFDFLFDMFAYLVIRGNACRCSHMHRASKKFRCFVYSVINGAHERGFFRVRAVVCQVHGRTQINSLLNIHNSIQRGTWESRPITGEQRAAGRYEACRAYSERWKAGVERRRLDRMRRNAGNGNKQEKSIWNVRVRNIPNASAHNLCRALPNVLAFGWVA